MASVVRRGAELRKVVRQRRRMRWVAVVSTSMAVAAFGVIVSREADGLAIAGLCAMSAALLPHLVTFIPALELRTLRQEVSRPPITLAQAKRVSYSVLLVGVAAVAAALIAGALFDAWLTAVAVAAPIALLFSLFSFFLLRAGKRDSVQR